MVEEIEKELVQVGDKDRRAMAAFMECGVMPLLIHWNDVMPIIRKCRNTDFGDKAAVIHIKLELMKEIIDAVIVQVDLKKSVEAILKFITKYNHLKL